MNKIIIEESNMKFGPYDKEAVFLIEQSRVYKEIGNNVKIAEFVLEKSSQKINIFEVKSSSPQPKNSEDYDTFIRSIYEKFVNTFSLTLALILKRFPSHYEVLPERLEKIEVSNFKCLFVLVIYGHKEEWLLPIQDSLNKSLSSFFKIWNLPPTSVIVINEKIAKAKHIIK
jgi:hypothetical protein